MNKTISAHICTHYKNYKWPATNSTSFIYVLNWVRNCSQEIVPETCNVSLLSPNLQDVQLVYTYIASSNLILVIIMGELSKVSAAAMNPRVGHWQYLVTYSKADESKF